jgi:ketosteroid isomerase-like protein
MVVVGKEGSRKRALPPRTLSRRQEERPHMSKEEENRNTLKHYVHALARQDLDAIEDLLHDDYLEEYPHSGERIRGKHNWRTILQNYPGRPKIIDHSFKLGGGLGVAEMIAEYDGERVYACQTVELEDGKVKRVRTCFGGPFEAPQWRAQWVERM